jgi:hypothetical protein
VAQARFTLRKGAPGGRGALERLWDSWASSGAAAAWGGGAGGSGGGSSNAASAALIVDEGEPANPRVWVRLDYAIVNRPAP